jgi:hypothetical protein
MVIERVAQANKKKTFRKHMLTGNFPALLCSTG